MRLLDVLKRQLFKTVGFASLDDPILTRVIVPSGPGFGAYLEEVVEEQMGLEMCQIVRTRQDRASDVRPIRKFL